MELWMPGAERAEQPGAVQLDKSLPPRWTWHITADRLDAAGAQPPFDNVDAYLRRVAYCPSLMWDPFTGRMKQYYPASVGARALSNWNQDGRVHFQVEIYFAQGVVRGGKQYMTVAQTPLKGWDRLLAFADQMGVPRVWPNGAPNGLAQRDVDVWNTRAGHYGHSQVPGENHADPGPMPSLAAPAPAPPSAPAAPVSRPLLVSALGGLHA